jgi:hypothetical protein
VARKEILAARKHRNRLSAAAHRERKNNHIAELEHLVAELSDQNRFLTEALASSEQPTRRRSRVMAEARADDDVPARDSSSSSTIENTISPPAVCA